MFCCLCTLKCVQSAVTSIPNHHYHHIICALSTKNGVNTFQKVYKYLNTDLEKCVITLCKASSSSVCSLSLTNTSYHIVKNLAVKKFGQYGL